MRAIKPRAGLAAAAQAKKEAVEPTDVAVDSPRREGAGARRGDAGAKAGEVLFGAFVKRPD